MRGPRKPKDLDSYETSDLAALKLEALAKDLRRGPARLVKWSITVRFWEDPESPEVQARCFQAMGFSARNKERS
jgi:hypothetical protein